MGDVVDIRRKPRIFKSAGEPVERVVERLERLLDMAQTGELIGIAGVFLYRDEGTGAFLDGNISFATVGRMDEIKQNMLEDLNNR